MAPLFEKFIALNSNDMLDLTFIKKYNVTNQAIGLLLIISSFPAYLSGQCAMVCEDQINVGLRASTCETVITYDMILKGGSNPSNCTPNSSADFSLFLSKTKNGDAIPGSPTLTRDDLGTLFYATVTHLPSNTSCTGSVIVSDDQPPVINCPKDTLVDCGQILDTTFLGSVDLNTCVEVSIRVSDSKENLVLECSGLAERITRTFRVTSQNGLASSCTQTIEVKRPELSDLVFPPHHNGIEAPRLSCDGDYPGPETTGLPSFNGMPIDLNNGLCGYSTSFRDRKLDDCGHSFTIVRSWTVIDLCSNQVQRQDQVIIATDNEAPQIDCPDTLRVITTDPNTCTASILLPEVDITDNCSNFAVTVQTPVDDLNSNGGLVHNLPEGTNEVIYYATDECGQVGSCKTIVEVSDGTAPSLTCENRITVSLTDDGSAAFGAQSTILEVEDNCCSNLELQVRRLEENTFTDQITVTCADIGQSLLVLSKATDCNGNENLCMVQVDVVDNSANIQLECPDDIIVDCTADYSDPFVTGLPIISGTCATTSTQANFSDNVSNLTVCGTGSIVRTWALTIETDNESTCVQNIRVQDPTPLQISFPPDLTLSECASADAIKPEQLDAPYHQPQLSGELDCKQVQVEYEDLPLLSEPGIGLVLNRVWTVTEICAFDPFQPEADGIYRDTQRIVVNDTSPPIISCQESITVTANLNCVANIFIPRPIISGECFPGEVRISASGELGEGLFHQDVATGTYSTTLQATDRSGNSSTCDLVIRVVDAAAPEANCQQQLIANISSDGTVSIEGDQLNDGSFDDCTSLEDLSFRIGRSTASGTGGPPQDLFLVFDCQEVGTTVGATLWVGDASGNWSSCTADIQISDNDNYCASGASAAMVAGVVQSPSGAMVDQVELRIAQQTSMPMAVTGADGAFSFAALPIHGNYRIIPQRPTPYNESISTFDLVKLTQHLTGRQELSSPYLQIAADINGDARISIFDAIILQKLILNLETEVKNNLAWRFVPSEFAFPDPSNALVSGFPEFMDIENLDGDYMQADFIGIKVGDLNMSYSPENSRPLEARGEALTLGLQDQHLVPGQEVELSFKLGAINKLGFQMALALSPDLEVLGLEAPGFGKGIQYSEIRPGELRISAIQTEGKMVDEVECLQLKVRAKKAIQLSEGIRLAEELMSAELITDVVSAPKSLRLEFEKEPAKNEFVAQLSPNPMIGGLSYLQLEREANEPIHYQLWTTGGRLLLSGRVEPGKGKISIPIRREQLSGPGIYFLQVISQRNTKTLRLLNP